MHGKLGHLGNYQKSHLKGSRPIDLQVKQKALTNDLKSWASSPSDTLVGPSLYRASKIITKTLGLGPETDR